MRASVFPALTLASALLAGSAGAAAAAVAVAGVGPEKLCYIAARTGQYPSDGIDDCNHALSDSPLTLADRASTYDNRGILEAALGHHDVAMQDYEKSLSLNPVLGDAHLNRGTVLILRHQYDDAIGEIELGMKYGLSLPEVGYYDRAIAEEGLGHIADAYHDYQKTLEVAPYFAPAVEQLKRFTVTHSDDDKG